MAVRVPVGPLRRFVRVLWASDANGPELPLGSLKEIVLPTGDAHIALRLSDEPLRVCSPSGAFEDRAVGTAVAGGPRVTPYRKDVSRPSASVGAQLLPGAVPALLGVSAGELLDQHVALPLLWGRAVDDLQEELWSLRRDLPRALDRFEAFLLARLTAPRSVAPAALAALEELERSGDVARAVQTSGYSHRHLIALFREAVGTTPRAYLQVRRFRRAVELLRSQPGRTLAEVALDGGFADQAHLTRAFRRHAGLTPGTYLSIAPARAHHVPLRPPSRRQNRSRPSGAAMAGSSPGAET